MIFKRFYLILMLFVGVYAQDKEIWKKGKSSEFKQKLASIENAPTVPGKPVSLDDIEAPISLGITVPTEFQNSTLIDHHVYYNSTFYLTPEQADVYWSDLEQSSQAKVHDMLSNSHRQATTVELSFEFPFYGHTLRNITIATGGFLYMGDYLHNWIAATQYIAPLMANFDTSQSPDSVIKYMDNGTAFTVQWGNVFVQDRMKDGAFTFQVTLHKNGDIVFAYRDIPFPVSNISDSRHPVKIGISDAYILERSLFFVRRKTIYEYHRIDMKERKIGNHTALYFTALPTCPGFKDCSSCLSADSSLDCSWCESLNRCSDGIDRSRQTWVGSGCDKNKVNTCPAQGGKSDTTYTVINKDTESSTNLNGKGSAPSKYEKINEYNVDTKDKRVEGSQQFIQAEERALVVGGLTAGAVATIVVFVAILLLTFGWIGYAYKNPETPSGQFLIKYRPAQWSLRNKDESATISSNSRHY